MLLLRRCRRLVHAQYSISRLTQATCTAPTPSSTSTLPPTWRPLPWCHAMLHTDDEDTRHNLQRNHHNQRVYTLAHRQIHRLTDPHQVNSAAHAFTNHHRSIHHSRITSELGVVSKLSMTQLAHRHETQLLSHAHSIEVVEFCLDGSVAEKVCGLRVFPTEVCFTCTTWKCCVCCPIGHSCLVFSLHNFPFVFTPTTDHHIGVPPPAPQGHAALPQCLLLTTQVGLLCVMMCVVHDICCIQPHTHYNNTITLPYCRHTHHHHHHATHNHAPTGPSWQ